MMITKLNRSFRLLSAGAALSLLMVAAPGVSGVQLYVHDTLPVVRRQVIPPSTDTSTALTIPPLSNAVPLMLTVTPAGRVVPAVGLAIVEVGARVSVEGPAMTSAG